MNLLIRKLVANTVLHCGLLLLRGHNMSEEGFFFLLQMKQEQTCSVSQLVTIASHAEWSHFLEHLIHA